MSCIKPGIRGPWGLGVSLETRGGLGGPWGFGGELGGVPWRLGVPGDSGVRGDSGVPGCSVVPLDSPGGVGGCGIFQLPLINLQQFFDILINADNCTRDHKNISFEHPVLTKMALWTSYNITAICYSQLCRLFLVEYIMWLFNHGHIPYSFQFYE